MEKYFAIKIPFGSKSYIKKKNSNLVMKADAFYIFDKNTNKYIHEYIQLHNSNYRITDLEMIKPTSYYSNKKVRKFRDEFLDKFLKPEQLNKQGINYRELAKDEIAEINKFLSSNKFTIRNSYALFSGSNPSGAETNHDSTPIPCIDTKYFFCNFANVLKKYECSKKEQKIINNIQEIYTLEDILEKNKIYIDGFKEIFYEYNEFLNYKDNEAELYIDNNIIDFKLDDRIDYKFKPKDNQLLFMDGINNKTLENIDDNTIKLRLRSFYTSNVKSYISSGKIPLHSTTDKIRLDVIVNAHIIDFHILLKEKNYIDAINPYNCLRIDNQTHKLYDDKKYYFDLIGNIVDINSNQLYRENYLDINNIPNETKKFIKKYNEKYLNIN